MGYLSITRIAGDPAELLAAYRETAADMAEVGDDHGLLVHAAAATEDGLLLVNVWLSAEGSRAAAADPRRLRVLAQHGLGAGELRTEHHELAELALPAGAPR